MKNGCRVLVLLLCALLLTTSLQVSASGGVVVKSLSASAVIEGVYAVTTVTEELENTGSSAAEAEFTFAVPEGNFISGFSLTSGGLTYTAKVLTKGEAEKVYGASASKGDSAALLSARGKGLFSYTVSIPAGQTTLLTLKYEGAVQKRLGTYTYILPLTGRAYGGSFGSMSVLVDVHAPGTIESLSTSYDATVKNMSESRRVVSYTASPAAPTKDFTVSYRLAVQPAGGTIATGEKDGTGYFLHLYSPPASATGTLDKAIVFALDRSGSMAGTKISQLREAFRAVLGQLRPGDRFNLVQFNSKVSLYSSTFAPATPGEAALAADYMDDTGATGGTNLNGGVLMGLSLFHGTDGAPILVLLTDGQPTDGETDTADIRANVRSANTAGAGVYSLGFGGDVDFAFLQALSLENGGSAQRIYEGSDAAGQIKDFYQTISTPLLRNLRIRYTGATDVVGGDAGYLFDGSDAVAVGKYSPSAGNMTATVSATGGSGPVSSSYTFDMGAAEKYQSLPRYWAYMKVRSLLDRVAVEGETAALTAEITTIALDNSFVTPYTSLVIDTSRPDSTKVRVPSFQTLPGGPVGTTSTSMTPAKKAGEPWAPVVVMAAIVALVVAGRRGRRSG